MSKKTVKSLSFHGVKSLGSDISDIEKTIDHNKSKGGLLPSINRTRGPMNKDTPLTVRFESRPSNRRISLSLFFAPVIEAPKHQGAFDSFVPGDSFPAVPTFIEPTTPGDLLLMFASRTEGNFAFNTVSPPVFTGPAWNQLQWHTTIRGDTGEGALAPLGFGVFWRRVGPSERTTQPTSIITGAFNADAVYIWEVRGNVGDPVLSTGEYTIVNNPDKHYLGTDNLSGFLVGGIGIQQFGFEISPIISTLSQQETSTVQIVDGTATASEVGTGGPPSDAIDLNADTGWNVDGHGAKHAWIMVTYPGANGHKMSFLTAFNRKFVFTPGADNNPPSTWHIDDSGDPNGSPTGFDVDFGVIPPGSAGQLDVRDPDTRQPRLIKSIKITFNDNVPVAPEQESNPGWYEILATNIALTKQIELQNNTMRNIEGINIPGFQWQPPWIYIGQRRFGASGPGKLGVYMTSTPIGQSNTANSWPVVSATVVIPNMKTPLPHVPYPENQVIVTSGVSTVASDLYASGVRIYVDGQDITQFIAGTPSLVIDPSNNRFDDIDISLWVKSPGAHTLGITTDEGEADVDTRFETI